MNTLLTATCMLLLSALVHGQLLQGGYDAIRSNQIPFAKSHASWSSKVPYSGHTNFGYEEPVFDSIRGKAYSQYSFLPNFSVVEVDLITGKSNLINITIPNIEKLVEFYGISSARLDSKGNYFVCVSTLINNVVIRADLSTKLGKIVSLGVSRNVYTTILSETEDLFIIGTSEDVIALDATTLSQKWIVKFPAKRLLLVNSEISGHDVIYVTSGQTIYRILAVNGKIMSSYKFKHNVDNISYVRGLNGWLSVTLANSTSAYSGFLNMDKQIATTRDVVDGDYDPRFPSASAGCNYPMAVSNQTGNVIEIISVAKCSVPYDGYYETYIIAIRSRFDSNSLKPLSNEPSLIWKTLTSTYSTAQLDSKTFFSVETSPITGSSFQYLQYDTASGKVIKTVPSTIPSNDGSPNFVGGNNKKAYTFSNDLIESVDL